MPLAATADIENCPCELGSGKFGSPCERTQTANFVICETLPCTSAYDARPALFPDGAPVLPDVPPPLTGEAPWDQPPLPVVGGVRPPSALLGRPAGMWVLHAL